jgi:hypothetical protein
VLAVFGRKGEKGGESIPVFRQPLCCFEVFSIKLLQEFCFFFFSVVSMKRDIGEEIFDLLDRRKYSSTMILTSNRDIKE